MNIAERYNGFEIYQTNPRQVSGLRRPCRDPNENPLLNVETGA